MDDEDEGVGLTGGRPGRPSAPEEGLIGWLQGRVSVPMWALVGNTLFLLLTVASLYTLIAEQKSIMASMADVAGQRASNAAAKGGMCTCPTQADLCGKPKRTECPVCVCAPSEAAPIAQGHIDCSACPPVPAAITAPVDCPPPTICPDAASEPAEEAGTGTAGAALAGADAPRMLCPVHDEDAAMDEMDETADAGAARNFRSGSKDRPRMRDAAKAIGRNGPNFPIAAHHVMLDMAKVDAARLTCDSLVKHIQEFLAALSSYKKPSLAPVDVSAVAAPDGVITATAVLTQGTLTVHAWPMRSYAAVDLFVYGTTKPPLQLLAPLYDLLGASNGPDEPFPPANVSSPSWSTRKRGIDSRDLEWASEDTDVYVLAEHTSDKRLVHHAQSEFQDIQVWELTDNWFIDAEDGNRCLFLDGTLQSCLSDEHVYHETLVHPAMFAHEDPGRVAILGGGEGATLREVLRHDTVTQVMMVEIDKGVVEAGRQALPTMPADSWSDQRSVHVAESAETWFESRYGGGKECGGDGDRACFDVIIVDVQDPELAPTFTKGLFSTQFMRTLSNALDDEGVLVWQIGEGAVVMDTDEADLITMRFLEQTAAVMDGVQVYSEVIPSFQNSWDFMIAFQRPDEKRRFMRNAAAIDLDIRQRLKKGPAGVLVHFDGTTMQKFREVPKAYQHHFCSAKWAEMAADPAAVRDRCAFIGMAGLDGGVDYEEGRPEEFLEVKRSKHISSGQGVFVTADVGESERFGAYDAATSMQVPLDMYRMLKDFAAEHTTDGPLYQSLLDWIDRFGYFCDYEGGEYYISVGSKNTFTNHACDEKAALIQGPFDSGLTGEALWRGATDLPGAKELDAEMWDVLSIRNRRTVCVEQRTRRALKKGEEILDSFVNYYDPDVQPEKIKQVRGWCGEKVAAQVQAAAAVAAEGDDEDEDEGDDDDEDEGDDEDDDKDDEDEGEDGEAAAAEPVAAAAEPVAAAAEPVAAAAEPVAAAAEPVAAAAEPGAAAAEPGAAAAEPGAAAAEPGAAPFHRHPRRRAQAEAAGGAAPFQKHPRRRAQAEAPAATAEGRRRHKHGG